jgi:hypothetical protein
MKFNIVGLAYLFLRLAPFILVSFFTLSSFFNQDFKGIIYLAGLLLAITFNILIGNGFGFAGKGPYSNEICSMIEIGEQQEFSKLPMSQCILGYTFFYLLYVIVKYNYVMYNLPTLIFFPVLIISDLLWNVNNSCYNMLSLGTSLLIGIIFGSIWAIIIDEFKLTSLQYFNNVAGNDVCKRPSNQSFKCDVYKNGKLLSKNN